MPSSVSDSVAYDRIERVHKYHWPAIPLNLWMVMMLISSCTIIGVFSTFIDVQQTLLLPIPWYFPYFITVACLTVVFVGLLVWLIFSRRLLPSIVILGGFMLFVMWMVGLTVTSVQLWGPNAYVNNNCQLAVFNEHPTGQYSGTLAWLEQKSICQSWFAVFSLGLVGCVFLLWIMMMAFQVFAENS